MLQTAIVVVTLHKANLVMAELAGAGAEIVSVRPIFTGSLSGDDLLVVFHQEHESEDAQYAFLSWVEDTIGPNCKVY